MTHEKNFGSADATVVAPQTLSGLSGDASVAEQFQGIANHIVAEIAALRAQRDELAAALREITDAYWTASTEADPAANAAKNRLLNNARAAIAKLDGGK